MPISKAKKAAFLKRMQVVFATYSKFFVVLVDNVGSRSIQKTRYEMRGTAEIVMGKKTLLRKALSIFMEANPGHMMGQIEQFMYLTTGFVFTNGDLGKVRAMIAANKVPAPARPGAIAPANVNVPAGPTGCDPGQTGFFQVLQIPTKIVKGQIEITSVVELITEGDKVGPSEAALLDKLNIRPFEYGFKIKKIFDNGSIYDIAVLDITADVLTSIFCASIKDIAAVSLALSYPTAASFPHSMGNAFKDLCAIVVGLDTYSFPLADPYNAYVKDPSAFAAAAAPAAGGAAPAAAAAPAKAVVEEVDPMEGGMNMFGASADY
jgi:large subunit ribosomal protein LP0